MVPLPFTQSPSMHRSAPAKVGMNKNKNKKKLEFIGFGFIFLSLFFMFPCNNGSESKKWGAGKPLYTLVAGLHKARRCDKKCYLN
jgi:hypothetical protein